MLQSDRFVSTMKQTSQIVKNTTNIQETEGFLMLLKPASCITTAIHHILDITSLGNCEYLKEEETWT